MLSVIIITKNEERNIKRCLESIKWADEIIVLDSGSTDNTVDIAKQYTPKVFQTDWQGYGVQKQRALSYATNEWVLNLDADESVDLVLKSQIQKVMYRNKAQAYRIPIQMYFYNKPLKYSASPSRHVRLFKREGACYSNDLVHEKIILPKEFKIGRIKSAIQHHSYRDISHAIYKMNLYSSYTAKMRIDKNKQGSFVKSIGSMTWMFLRCYFLQRGFLDGKAGLVFALISSQGAFYRGIKQLYPDQV